MLQLGGGGIILHAHFTLPETLKTNGHVSQAATLHPNCSPPPSSPPASVHLSPSWSPDAFSAPLLVTTCQYAPPLPDQAPVTRPSLENHDQLLPTAAIKHSPGGVHSLLWQADALRRALLTT